MYQDGQANDRYKNSTSVFFFDHLTSPTHYVIHHDGIESHLVFSNQWESLNFRLHKKSAIVIL